jgi:hypothetical protein
VCSFGSNLNEKTTNFIPPSSDLYTNQMYFTNEWQLNQPGIDGANQLMTSNGEAKMINIPLQMNYPYNEPLRTTEVLITPYNKIKYC